MQTPKRKNQQRTDVSAQLTPIMDHLSELVNVEGNASPQLRNVLRQLQEVMESPKQRTQKYPKLKITMTKQEGKRTKHQIESNTGTFWATDHDCVIEELSPKDSWYMFVAVCGLPSICIFLGENAQPNVTQFVEGIHEIYNLLGHDVTNMKILSFKGKPFENTKKLTKDELNNEATFVLGKEGPTEQHSGKLWSCLDCPEKNCGWTRKRNFVRAHEASSKSKHRLFPTAAQHILASEVSWRKNVGINLVWGRIDDRQWREGFGQPLITDKEVQIARPVFSKTIIQQLKMEEVYDRPVAMGVKKLFQCTKQDKEIISNSNLQAPQLPPVLSLTSQEVAGGGSKSNISMKSLSTEVEKEEMHPPISDFHLWMQKGGKIAAKTKMGPTSKPASVMKCANEMWLNLASAEKQAIEEEHTAMVNAWNDRKNQYYKEKDRALRESNLIKPCSNITHENTTNKHSQLPKTLLAPQLPSSVLQTQRMATEGQKPKVFYERYPKRTRKHVVVHDNAEGNDDLSGSDDSFHDKVWKPEQEEQFMPISGDESEEEKQKSYCFKKKHKRIERRQDEDTDEDSSDEEEKENRQKRKQERRRMMTLWLDGEEHDEHIEWQWGPDDEYYI